LVFEKCRRCAEFFQIEESISDQTSTFLGYVKVSKNYKKESIIEKKAGEID